MNKDYMVLRYFRSFQNISSSGFYFRVVNNPFIIFIYINSENQFLSNNESNSKNDNINRDDKSNSYCKINFPFNFRFH